MDKFLFFAFIVFFSLSTQASWYWPFGSDDEKKEPRLSEIMEPVSLLIDEASDLAADGKVNEAVEKYRAALAELDRIEIENPERANKPEFATIKTKRAYIGAAIDSMLLEQARGNARAVAVSDTTELEAKLAEERGEKAKAKTAKSSETEEEKPVETLATVEKDERAPEELPEVKEASAEAERAAKREQVKDKLRAKRKGKKATATRPLTKREAVMKAIGEKNFDKADEIIAELLNEKPNNAAALNLRAAKETAEGNYKAAEKTLDQAIQSNPRDPYAYYNMAVLYLQAHPNNKSGARRYYETARTYGAPEDPELEAELE